MTKKEIVDYAKNHPNGLPAHDLDLDNAYNGSPIITSRGAVSICALRRRGKWIGFAVWSCQAQAFVRGGWSNPLSWQDAVQTERGMPWEG